MVTEPKKPTNQNNKETIDKSKVLLPQQVNNPKNTTAKAFQKTQGKLPTKKEIIKSGEIFIETTTYGQFCEEKNEKGIKHIYRETFFEGIFIAIFPEKMVKL